jgi:hypothetical protein
MVNQRIIKKTLLYQVNLTPKHLSEFLVELEMLETANKKNKKALKRRKTWT